MANWEEGSEVAAPGLNQHLPLVRQLEGSGDDAVSVAQGNGHGGAVGRYQIMPDTARRYGFDPSRLTDPVYAERVASKIMDDNMKRGGGRLDDALVLYNGSPKQYARWVKAGRDPAALSDETRKYLKRAELLHGGPLVAPAWEAGEEVSSPVPTSWEQGEEVKKRSPLEMVAEAGQAFVSDAARSAAGLVRGKVGQWETEANEAAKAGALPTIGLPGAPMSAPIPEAVTAQARREIAANPHPTQEAVAKAVSPLQTWGDEHAVENPDWAGTAGGFMGGMMPALAGGLLGPAGMIETFQGQGFDEGQHDALAHGATQDEADASGLYHAGIGGIAGAIPIGEIAGLPIERLGLKGLTGWAGTRIASAGTMGTVMAGQTVANNAVAKQTYDPNRPWDQQVGEAFISGALGDLAFGGVVHPAINVAVHPVKIALGAGHQWATGALRPAERPEGAPKVDPSQIPATDALQRYAGVRPAKAPEPHEVFEQSLMDTGSAPGADGATWHVRRNPHGNEQTGLYEIAATRPGEPTQFVGGREPLNSLEQAAREAARIAHPDANIQPHDSTWTPEREAAWQAQRDADGLQPGDPALVETAAGQIKAEVVHVERPAGEEPKVRIKTPRGEATVRASNVVGLPKDYEAQREAYGAPLEQMPQAIADVSAWRASPKGYHLFQAIKDLGGIRTKDDAGAPNDAAEILRAGAKGLVPGTINNKTGLHPDEMRARLQQRGWFGTFDQSQSSAAHDTGHERPGDHQNHLWEAMRDQAQNGTRFHPETQSKEALAHREDIEQQMNAAGVALTDPPHVAAAKLARWRGEQVKARSPEAEELREKAKALGIYVWPDMTPAEIRKEILAHEAAVAEHADTLEEVMSGDELDHYIDAIDAELTPEQQYAHAALTPEEHEWLSHPDRGPVGGEAEAGQLEADGARTAADAAGAGEAEGARALDGVGGEDRPGEGPTEQEGLGRYGIADSVYTPTDQNLQQKAEWAERRRAVAHVHEGDIFIDPLTEERLIVRRRAAGEYNGKHRGLSIRMESESGEGNIYSLVDNGGDGKDLGYIGRLLVHAPEADQLKWKGRLPSEREKRRAARYDKPGAKKREPRTAEEHDDDALDHEDTAADWQRMHDEGKSSGLYPYDHLAEVARHAGRRAREAAKKARGEPHEELWQFANTRSEGDHWINQHQSMAKNAPEAPPLSTLSAEARAHVREFLESYADLPKHAKRLEELNALERGPEAEGPSGEQTRIPGSDVLDTGPLKPKAPQEGAGELFGQGKHEDPSDELARVNARIKAIGDKIKSDAEQTASLAPEGQREGAFEKAREMIAAGYEAELKELIVRQSVLNAKTGHSLFGERPAAKPYEPPPKFTLDEPAPPAEAPGYGEANKYVTKDVYEAAKKRMLDRQRNQLNAGIDPEAMHDGFLMTAYHIEAGARTFHDFARGMLADLGEWSRPYLKSWYESVRHAPGFDNAGMTPEREITPDLIAAAGRYGHAEKAPEPLPPVERVEVQAVHQAQVAERAHDLFQPAAMPTAGDAGEGAAALRKTLKREESATGPNGERVELTYNKGLGWAVSVAKDGIKETFGGAGGNLWSRNQAIDKATRELFPHEIGDRVTLKPEVAAQSPVAPGTERGVVGVSPDGKQVTLDGGAQFPAADLQPAKPERTTAGEEPANGLQGPLSDGATQRRPEDVHGVAPERPAGRAPAGKEPGSAPLFERDAGAGAEGAERAPAGPAGLPAGGRARDGADAGISDAAQSADAGAAGRSPDAFVTGENYAIEPGAVAEERGPKTKARDNLEAIRLAKQLIAEKRAATREEQAILAKYVGWGGLAGAFDAKHEGLRDIGEQLRKLLTPEEYETALRSTQYAHYTAEHVIRSMWKAVADMGFKGGKVLEPGMGVGHFLGMAPRDLAERIKYQGVEMDGLTADIAKLLYPKSGVRQADFTRTPIPENTFDLVIGNPPFSDTVIKADPKYAARGFMLHDYFFAKSLDSVRPGGLLAFVTSAGTMNKMSPEARQYLAERAHFLGGARLPSDTFRKNAGTDVTTDVLFFQKRDTIATKEEAAAEPWTETVIRELPGPPGEGPMKGHVNRYFSENPDQVLGDEGFFDKLYKGRYGVHAREGVNGETELARALDRLPKNVMREPPTAEEKAFVDFAAPEHKDGSFYLHEGKLMQYSDGAGRPVTGRAKGVEGGITAMDQQRITHLVPIRDALREVFHHDLAENHGPAAEARARLNAHYDTFVRKFGPINKAEFQYRRPTVVQQEAARAEAREQARDRGEVWNEGSYDPSRAPKATLAEQARARQELRDQMGAEFDEGDFSAAEMPDIVIEKRPNIAAFMDDPESYRLRAIESYNDASGQAAKKDIFHRSVITRELEPQLNSANDGVLWSLNKLGKFDADAIAKQMGKTREEILEELGDRVFRLPGTDATHVTADEYLSGDIYDKLAEARAAAAHDPDMRRNVAALEASLPAPLAPTEISMILGMPWIPADHVVEFARDHLRIGDIKARHNGALGGWVITSPKSRGAGDAEWSTDTTDAEHVLALAMNRLPVRIYKTVYIDGEKRNEFDPIATQAVVDKVDAMKQAFADFVANNPEREAGLADTYNTTLNRTVLRKYDGSYLTTPGISSDWSWRPHQQRVVSRIVQSGNTYMAHSVGAGKTSAMIGAGMEQRRLGLVQKPMYVVPNHMLGQFTKEFYEQYPTARIAVADERRFHTSRRKQFIANVAQEDLDAVIITHSAFGKIPISGEFQKTLIAREVDKIKAAMDGLDKHNDRLTIKKLEGLKEKMEQRLAGAMGSRKDATNTFEELGVDQIYVDEAHLFRKLSFATRQKMKGIDPDGSEMAWDLYSKIQHLETINPGRSVVLASGTPVTNTMGELYTLSRFMQPHELERQGLDHFDSWASTFGDTKTTLEQAPDGSYEPVTRFNKFVNMPELYKLVGQNMDIVTPAQLEQYVVRPKLKGGARQFHLAPSTDFMKQVQADLGARMEAIKRRKGPPEKGDDILLSVINDGRHSAIDPRFVEPHADPHGPSKLNMMLDNVHRIWRETANQQFYDPKTGYKAEHSRGPATQMIFSNLGINTSEKRPFSGYGWMKSELLRRGVPASEIAFIGDYKTTLARQKLFNDMNEGKVRILVGSSQKMGTGVNAQRRLAALHNLDPLWFPADDEQRCGRILRQGNLNPEIEIHDYSTKGTYDATMWQMMGNKARFIEQFFRGDPELREMEDLGEASHFEQAAAMATSDERLIVLTDYRQQLEKAERRKQTHERNQYSMGQRRRMEAGSIEDAENAIKEVQADIEMRRDTRGEAFNATVGGKKITDRVKAAEALEKEYKTVFPGLEFNETAKIGDVGGFNILVKKDIGDVPAFQLVRSYETQKLGDKSSSMKGILAAAEARIGRFEQEIEYHRKRQEEAKQAIASLDSQLGKPFTGGEEIESLRAKVKGLEAEIGATNAGAKSAAAPELGTGEPAPMTGLERMRARQASKEAPEMGSDDDVSEPSFARRPVDPNQRDMFGAPEAKPEAAPAVSKRLGMTPKEASARIPELQEAAAKVKAGEMTAAEYRQLVDRFKPVLPYDHIPQMATRAQIEGAVSSNKRDKVGAVAEYPDGHPVSIRLDIPAYTNHGVWVPTIHDAQSKKTVAYEPAVHITDASFGMSANEGLRIAQGGAKAPFAAINGKLKRTSPIDIAKQAQAALKDPAWRQVGMDPERHGYFYDRSTHEPITRAEEVLQVGPLVLAKNAETASLDDVKYARGPVFYSAVERHVQASQMKAAPAEQWKATINNAPGIKKEELEWTGLNDWLDLFPKGEKVPKEAVEAFLRENGVKIEEHTLTDHGGFDEDAHQEAIGAEQDLMATRNGGDPEDYYHEAHQAVYERWAEGHPQAQFSGWKLPGGEDYHELVFTLPKEAEPPQTHFDIPGVLAHTRFTTRTDPAGRKVLFLEEIQSDWHQKGRDNGYATPASLTERTAAKQRYAEATAALKQATANLRTPEMRQAVDATLAAYREESERHTERAQELKAEADRLLRDETIPLDVRQRSARAHSDALSARAESMEHEKRLERAQRLLADPHSYGDELYRALTAALHKLTEQSPLDDMVPVIEAWNTADLRHVEAMQAHQNADKGAGIPNAPFKAGWPALVMKRMIRWATDHGYERIAWTTGTQQGERYRLVKHIGRLTLHDNAAGGIGRARMDGEFRGGTLEIHDPNGRLISEETVYSHGQGKDTPETNARAHLEEMVGKELADRLLTQDPQATRGGHGWEQRTRRLDGLDIKTGDEGMKGFYDRNLVNIANDLIKKHGAKVDKGRVSTESYSKGTEEDIAAIMARGEREPAYRETEPYKRALEAIEEQNPEVHGFDLTDKLKEAAAGGQPLFKRGDGARERGKRLDDFIGPQDEPGHPTKDVPVDLRPKVQSLKRWGLELQRAKNPDEKAQLLIKAVDAELSRLVPFAESHPMESIREVGDGAEGGYTVDGLAWTQGVRSLIAWSINAKDAAGNPDGIGIGRHEAVHALRKRGLFRPEEWDALVNQAQEEGWIEKHNIGTRYADKTYDEQMEEAIAEEVRHWKYRAKPGEGFANRAMNKIVHTLDAVVDFVRRVLGKDLDAHDVIARIERGAVGKRLGKEEHENLEAAAPLVKERMGDPAFARRPRGAAETAAEAAEAQPERRRISLTDRILGRGLDRAGAKIKTAAERWTPDLAQAAIDGLKMGATPMGMGSVKAQAEAKDFANTVRSVVYEHGKVDQWLDRTFSAEAQKRMWEAADEHGVLLRRGVEPGPGQGKNRLSDAERAAVEHLQETANHAFAMAQEMEMVRGDGLESYVPRLVAKITTLGPRTLARETPRQIAKRGSNLSTTTGQLRQRKYETVGETEAAAKEHFGEGAMVVRNIRTLNMATQRLEQAIAGRVLVDKIKAAAKMAGADPVVEGGSNPDPQRYFTIEGHPALTKWKIKEFIKDPDTGKMRPKEDENGDPIMERVSLWIPKEYEGPLAAVLASRTGPAVSALLELKSKMMSVIMYNPMIHNMVIWGKAIPADPRGVFMVYGPGGAYARGHEAKMNPDTMREALAAGLDPIGKRYQAQDLGSLATEEMVSPGRSWTAQVLGFVPGLFNRNAGDAVKRGVDRLGDVWHNTFLWDRVADLQMGLYVKIRDQLLRQSNTTGMDAQTAQRIAAHFANRYAGALPMEAMSKISRNIANIVLFSRSFTLGNLAAFKDMIAGLPSDVRAQIERDTGKDKLHTAQGISRRKAIGMLVLDIALSHAGLMLAAAMTAWLTQQKYQDPSDNEEGRTNRFLIGYQKDGTAIYGRLPTGKVGEELVDYMKDPVGLFLRKLSPYGRFVWLVLTNDKGFGQKLVNPSEHTAIVSPMERLALAANEAFLKGLFPESQLEGVKDLLSGSKDPAASALRAFLPLTGITVARGAPGGPGVGDLYSARAKHDFKVQQAMPDIRKQIVAGDIKGARAKMRELGIPPGLQNYYVRIARNPSLRLSPKQLRDFRAYASPEEKERMERSRKGMAERRRAQLAEGDDGGDAE